MDETMNERMLEEMDGPMWHPIQQVNDEVNLRLAGLMRLGFADAASIEQAPQSYLRIVAGTLAGAVVSMPAVQRAMKAAYPDFTIEEKYRAVVLAIARMLTVDGEALLKAELKPREVRPQPDLGSLPSGPVN
jgi:hypothetical protein